MTKEICYKVKFEYKEHSRQFLHEENIEMIFSYL